MLAATIPPPISLLLCRHTVSRETGHLGNSMPPPNPLGGIVPSSLAQFGVLLSSKHQEHSAPAYADTMLDRLAALQIVKCASVFGQLQDLIRRGERERPRQRCLEVFLKELTVPAAAREKRHIHPATRGTAVTVPFSSWMGGVRF